MRVLVVVDNLEFGGVAKVARNFSESCSKVSNITFDYICYTIPSQETINELNSRGSRFNVVPRVSNVLFKKYIENIRKVIKSANYEAIHIHTSYFIWLAAYAAKKEGVKIRIGHAHGSIGPYSTLIKKQKITKIIQSKIVEILGRFMNKRYCTHMLACAYESGKYTFGDRFEFLPNITNYSNIVKIDSKKTNDYYDEFRISKGSIVLGYLGVVGLLKNTKFFVPLMKQLSAEKDQYVLVIAGDGPDSELIERMIKSEGLTNKIIMAGHRRDNHELLQFFDILLMPSFTEGMSLSILEAQICDTPVIASKGVPRTNDTGLKLFNKTKSFDVREWVDLIYKTTINKERKIYQNIAFLEKSKYGEMNIANRLLEIYSINNDEKVGGLKL